MARMKGTLTAISSARSASDSLRTTIPVFVVSQMDLTAKDQLEWKVDKLGDEWVATISKAT